MGFVGYWVGIVPHLDVPGWLKPFLWGLMFVIEVAGLLIRHIVLAVRLFANMFAGHVVLAVILGFILMAMWQPVVLGLVMPASIVGVILPEPAGAVRGVFASVYFYFFVRACSSGRRFIRTERVRRFGNGVAGRGSRPARGS